METKPNPAAETKHGTARLVLRWIFLVASAVALFFIGFGWIVWALYGEPSIPRSRGEVIVFVLVRVVAGAFLLALVMPILRRVTGPSLFTWRMARRFLIGAAVLATFIAIFYAEENWRGRRVWEQRKRELAAKGEVLNWNACIPPPVPDDENIMKAPKMADWFVKPKPGANLTNGLNLSQAWEKSKRNESKEPILLARVLVVPVNSSAASDVDALIRFDSPGASASLRKCVQDVIGPYAISPRGDGPILRQPLSQTQPKRVLLQADTPLTSADVSRILPTDSIPSDLGRLRVEADGGKDAFRILLAANPTLSAEEFLAESDQFTPELDLIREALKRPHIRIDGDFQRPFQMPIMGFVNVRNVSQVAAQRTQCCLLLGRSDQAFRELSLIFEMRRLLTAKPTMLVASMIDVAISGLYVQTIADGFRLQAWREPELVALQEQLQHVNLLLAVAESFHMERVGICHTLETSSPRELARLFFLGRSEDSFWKRITEPTFLLLKVAPRGWLYQNLAVSATMTSLEAFDTERGIIKPGVAEAATRDIERIAAHPSPYTILAAIALPNFTRATQTTARNQTWVNEAFLVCGLERYRLMHGSYPENLGVLVPQFVEEIPRDIIGGQPLHYRLMPDGNFSLYSVGWNEKDDGRDPGTDRKKDDWVWPPTVK